MTEWPHKRVMFITRKAYRQMRRAGVDLTGVEVRFYPRRPLRVWLRDQTRRKR